MAKHKLHSTADSKPREIAILMARADSQEQLEREVLPSLEELTALVNCCGVEVACQVTQIRPRRDPAFYLGRGKIEEIRDWAEKLEATLLICDEELSGSQLRKLEQVTGLRVLDRTTVILDIFASQATSHEGRIQVELAQHRYRLNRLIQTDPAALDRLGGGIGTRGPGETKLETDRRHIRRRIQALEEQLERVAEHRQRMRHSRKREGRFTFAVVGYTNAGKSTLVNTLCQSAVHVQDRLFATLDPVARRLKYDPQCLKACTGRDQLAREPLLVDTVGFIRRLPHALVEAFKSTLQEAAEADALILVLNVADPEVLAQWAVTESVLASLGAGHLPLVVVFNQIDRLTACGGHGEDPWPGLMAKLHEAQRTQTVCAFKTSAKTGEGVEALRAGLLARVAESDPLLA